MKIRASARACLTKAIGKFVERGAKTDLDRVVHRLGLEELEGRVYLGQLGKGGQGQVCRYAEADGREVAVKLLIAPTDPHAVTRFQAEAKALLDIRAMNLGTSVIRALTEARKVPNLPVHYFVMEKAAGESLATLIEKTPPPWNWRTAIETVWRVAVAISPAHALGIVHRDLHPGNVMLDNSKYRSPARNVAPPACATVLDFGVHRYSLRLPDDGLADPAPTFRPVGSVRYASPEALTDPESVTIRSDVWALGTMLFVLLTNEFPFEGRTLRDLADAKRKGQARRREAAMGATAREDTLLSDVLGLLLRPDPRGRPVGSEVRDICGDVLLYDLADHFAGDEEFRRLYLEKHGNVGFCMNCRRVAGRDGTMCEGCGHRDAEYNHWSYG